MIECPYCGHKQNINHDDGYGYEEDEIHQQACYNCDKTFTYITSIHFYYKVYKAPCLNGGEHNWKPIHGIPEEYFANKQRCFYCGEERTI